MIGQYPLGMLGTDLGSRGGGGAAPQTTFFIAAAGSDSNPGTQASPWQTLAKVNAQTPSPGFVYNFNGGDTFTGTLTLPAVSGTIGNSIKYQSYGTGQAKIAPSAGSDGIQLTNLAYVTVNNLNVFGTGTGSTGRGINNLWNTASTVFFGVTISNCTVSGFAADGIFSNINSTTTQSNGLTITGCFVNGCTFGLIAGVTGGILVRGSSNFQGSAHSNLNAAITNNVCTNNKGVAGAANWSGSGIFLGDCDGALISNCWADNNGANSNSTAGPSGIWMASCINSMIDQCSATNTKSAGGDGGGYDLDAGCANCIVQRCTSAGNQAYGFMSYVFDGAQYTGNTGNVFRYNVANNDGQGAFRIVSGGTTGNSGVAYGNTFITNTAAVNVKVEKFGGAMNWTIANNVFQNVSGNTVDMILTAANPANVLFFGNSYLSAGTFRLTWNAVAYASVALWRAAVTSQETIAAADTSKALTPTYISATGAPYLHGYNPEPTRPLETSPVLNAGVDLFANFGINPGTVDMFGSAVSTAGPWSIGHAAMKSALKSVVINTVGSSNFTIPADFAQMFRVDTIAAGGSNSANQTGAGGSAYAGSALSGLVASWVAGTSVVPYVVGAAVATADGQATAFGATSLAAAVALGPNSAVGADSGKTNATGVGGLGGLAANSVGTLKYNGGNGGNTGVGGPGGGGGGSAGSLGPGANGGNGGTTGLAGGGGGGGNGGLAGFTGTTTTGAVGGAGPFGNAGGAGGTTNGTNGTNGSGGGSAGTGGGTGGLGGNGGDWSTNGPGGGAGGAIGSNPGTGTGGLYGGGAGPRNNGNGGQGGIRFLYKTSASL